jgi:FkbM family methyltransferase
MHFSQLNRKLREYTALFGWRGVLYAGVSRLVRHPFHMSLKTRYVDQPLRFRLKTSDVPIAVQIFVDEEYGFEACRPIRTILDAGANTGFSSLYFAQRYPEAEIIALEPEAENVAMLRRNTASCPRIQTKQLALWSRDATLEVVDWFGKCGYRTKAADDEMRGAVCGAVRGISIPSLMQEAGWDRIDFLKMDIEGAEKAVLDGPPSWLDRVGIMAVETHDWLDPDCSRVVAAAAARFEKRWKVGENDFFARTGWV